MNSHIRVPFPINCDQVPNSVKNQDYAKYIQSLLENCYLTIMENPKQ